MHISALRSANEFHTGQTPVFSPGTVYRAPSDFPIFGRHLFRIGQFLHAQKEYRATLRVMKLVSPYFLSPYGNGSPLDVKKRKIDGIWHTVERFNLKIPNLWPRAAGPRPLSF